MTEILGTQYMAINFHENRNGSMKAADNFLDPNKASSLLSSGFSPDFATVITMDRKAANNKQI